MYKTLITAIALAFLLNSNLAATDSSSTSTPKSRHAAVIYSLFSTSVPVVVGAVMMNSEHNAPLGTGIASLGLICGPGVGHAYAGNMKRFWAGAAIRGMILSSSVAVAAILIHDSFEDTWEEGLPKAMLAVGVIGAGVTICTVSAIRDIATADNSADAYNSEHGFQTLTLGPTYLASQRAPGVMLTLSL